MDTEIASVRMNVCVCIYVYTLMSGVLVRLGLNIFIGIYMYLCIT